MQENKKTWNGQEIVDKFVYVDGIVGRTSPEIAGKTSSDHIVLTDVHANGSYFRDHIWLKITRRMKNANLQKGQRIFFTATSYKYIDQGNPKTPKIGFTNKRNFQKKQPKSGSGWDRK